MEPNTEKIEDDLKLTKKDIALTLGKAGVSAIPCIGGSIATLIDGLVTTPLEKRRNEWLVYIVEKLQILEKTVESFKIENLKNNEGFTDIFVMSMLSAIKNNQEEKRQMLSNIILNNAIENISIEHSQKLTFIRYVDELEPIHISLLQFIKNSKDEIENIQKTNPQKYRTTSETDTRENPIVDLLLSAFPSLEGKHKRYLQDLMTRGLVKYHSMHLGTDFNNIVKNGGVSQEGEDFLCFIKNSF